MSAVTETHCHSGASERVSEECVCVCVCVAFMHVCSLLLFEVSRGLGSASHLCAECGDGLLFGSSKCV